MSDLNGTDVHIHSGRPARLFSELTNVFVKQRPETTLERMQRVFTALRKRCRDSCGRRARSPRSRSVRRLF
jgi:hypothetical protein